MFQVPVQVSSPPGNGYEIDVACGDSVDVVDPTPYHVVLVVPSTSSLVIRPAFHKCRRFFFVGFSSL